MVKRDDFRQVARAIRRELDEARQAFRTYHRERFSTELKDVGGVGSHAGGETTDDDMRAAFLDEGLLIYPELGKTEKDGYTRVYRSGSRIASILNAIRFPGGGSDEELAMLLGRLRGPREGSDD